MEGAHDPGHFKILLTKYATGGLEFQFLIQYIPLKTGFVRQMLAPYSSYSAFVWHACK